MLLLRLVSDDDDITISEEAQRAAAQDCVIVQLEMQVTLLPQKTESLLKLQLCSDVAAVLTGTCCAARDRGHNKFNTYLRNQVGYSLRLLFRLQGVPAKTLLLEQARQGCQTKYGLSSTL